MASESRLSLVRKRTSATGSSTEKTGSYLRDRDLQREIEEGLNVVEFWNAANAVIYYGKGGEISTNRREEAEMAALCLRILQAGRVLVNTLMLQAFLPSRGGRACSPPPTGAA